MFTHRAGGRVELAGRAVCGISIEGSIGAARRVRLRGRLWRRRAGIPAHQRCVLAKRVRTQGRADGPVERSHPPRRDCRRNEEVSPQRLGERPMRCFVRCPNCRQKLLLAANEEGRKKRCPRCATRFAVGSPLQAVAGLAEYQAFELADQDATDDIEVLDDDRIDVLDNWPPKSPVQATPPTPRPHPPPPPEASPSRRRRRSTFADEYFNPEAEDYHFDPRDRPRWNMVQWGVTLV